PGVETVLQLAGAIAVELRHEPSVSAGAQACDIPESLGRGASRDPARARSTLARSRAYCSGSRPWEGTMRAATLVGLVIASGIAVGCGDDGSAPKDADDIDAAVS